MTRMTGPDCAVMCNLINTHTHTQQGGGNGDGNGVGGGNGNEVGGGGERRSARGERGREWGRSGAGTGTRRGVETPGRTQDGNGDGSGDRNGSSSGDGNGDEDVNRNRNEDRVGEDGRGAKKRKKPHKSCRCHVENEGNLVERGKSVEKKGLVQWLPTQIIWRRTGKQGREHKVPSA